MPLQYSRRVVVGTAVAVGLAAAGIIGSAAAITTNLERPRVAQDVRRAEPRPDRSFQIDNYQRMRGLFIEPTSGRPH